MATNNAINQIGVLPSFSAYSAADQSLVTGDATVYPIVFPDILYNRTSSFDGTSTFTAPLTGTYIFNVGVYFNGFTALNVTVESTLSLVTTGKTYLLEFWGESSGQYLPPIALGGTRSQICHLTVGDTVQVTLTVSQNGAKSITILGKAGAVFYTPIFSGYMIAGI